MWIHFFQPDKYFLFEAEKAERLAQMKIPIDFWNNQTAEAFTCFYEGVYITIFKTVGRTSQRIRFSKAHELGHIVLNHFTEFEQPDSYSIYKSTASQTKSGTGKRASFCLIAISTSTSRRLYSLKRITEKQTQRKMMENFMEVLRRLPEQVDYFDEAAWYAMVDFVTVCGKDDVRFTFKNGMVVKV